MENAKKRIIIVGGVAGGANVAVRARRLSETAEIIIVERGSYISYANCGLPYHIGGEIDDRNKLIIHSADSLKKRFNINVLLNYNAEKINREEKLVVVKNLKSGKSEVLAYDHLVLSTGAAPFLPPIPGINQQGHFTLRDVSNMDDIIAWCDARPVKKAVVVGGGYVGIEITEQLKKRKIDVTIVEALPQVLSPFDHDMAEYFHEELRRNDIRVLLKDAVSRFDEPSGFACASTVVTNSGERIPADLVIISVGVKPETKLAKDSGLDLGEKGGIRVNENLQTSDPSIWAVGDVIEVRDFVTNDWALIPLAGPANRQGRMVADNIFGFGRVYRGTLGTSILRCFGLTGACTGANEKTLKRSGLPYKTIYLHPFSHASYYPGASPLATKLLFCPKTGRVFGAQIIGLEGVDKRIDVIATAIKASMAVEDLSDLELAYAPPFGSAKDPVNICGMVATNITENLVQTVTWKEIEPILGEITLLDVREDSELSAGKIESSIHIPLNELRERLSEIPTEKPVICYCVSGLRSYYACRILLQNGFDCRNLNGAYMTWKIASKL